MARSQVAGMTRFTLPERKSSGWSTSARLVRRGARMTSTPWCLNRTRLRSHTMCGRRGQQSNATRWKQPPSRHRLLAIATAVHACVRINKIISLLCYRIQTNFTLFITFSRPLQYFLHNVLTHTHTHTHKVEALAAKNRRYLPSDMKFHFVDNDERDRSMRELSDLLAKEGVVADAWRAYANLVPYTYRVDLWKAAIVWAHGGLYMDHKVLLERPWSSWVDVRGGRLSICQDRCHQSLFCAFFASGARSPALAAVIRRHVAHIEMHFDGFANKLPEDMRPVDPISVLPQIGITSPLAWGWALEGHDVHVACWFMEHIPCRVPVVSFDHAVHMQGKNTKTGNNYEQLWERGLVYCDRVKPGDLVGVPHSCHCNASACSAMRWPPEKSATVF